jgi:hypothetical protein
VPRKADPLSEVERRTRELERAAQALARARAARDAAVIAAVEHGESLRVVGEAAGISHEGVRKIVAAGD